MHIDAEVARFVSPVMIVIGTRDAGNRPDIGRTARQQSVPNTVED